VRGQLYVAGIEKVTRVCSFLLRLEKEKGKRREQALIRRRANKLQQETPKPSSLDVISW
jgi:hypothetical protein